MKLHRTSSKKLVLNHIGISTLTGHATANSATNATSASGSTTSINSTSGSGGGGGGSSSGTTTASNGSSGSGISADKVTAQGVPSQLQRIIDRVYFHVVHGAGNGASSSAPSAHLQRQRAMTERTRSRVVRTADFRALEVGSLMKQGLELWRLMDEEEVAKLKASLQDPGLLLVVHHNPDLIWALGALEVMERIELLAKAVAFLGVKCEDRQLRALEASFALLRSGSSAAEFAQFCLPSEEEALVQLYMQEQVDQMQELRKCMERLSVVRTNMKKRADASDKKSSLFSDLDDDEDDTVNGKTKLCKGAVVACVGGMLSSQTVAAEAMLENYPGGSELFQLMGRLTELQSESMWSADFDHLVRVLVLHVHALRSRFFATFGQNVNFEAAEYLARNSLYRAGLSSRYAKIVVILERMTTYPCMATSATSRNDLYSLLPGDIRKGFAKRLGKKRRWPITDPPPQKAGPAAPGSAGSLLSTEQSAPSVAARQQRGDSAVSAAPAAPAGSARPSTAAAKRSSLWDRLEDDDEAEALRPETGWGKPPNADEAEGKRASDEGGSGLARESMTEEEEAQKKKRAFEEQLRQHMKILPVLARNTCTWDEMYALKLSPGPRCFKKKVFKVQTLHLAQAERMTAILVDCLVGLTHLVASAKNPFDDPEPMLSVKPLTTRRSLPPPAQQSSRSGSAAAQAGVAGPEAAAAAAAGQKVTKVSISSSNISSSGSSTSHSIWAKISGGGSSSSAAVTAESCNDKGNAAAAAVTGRSPPLPPAAKLGGGMGRRRSKKELMPPLDLPIEGSGGSDMGAAGFGSRDRQRPQTADGEAFTSGPSSPTGFAMCIPHGQVPKESGSGKGGMGILRTLSLGVKPLGGGGGAGKSSGKGIVSRGKAAASALEGKGRGGAMDWEEALASFREQQEAEREKQELARRQQVLATVRGQGREGEGMSVEERESTGGVLRAGGPPILLGTGGLGGVSLIGGNQHRPRRAGLRRVSLDEHRENSLANGGVEGKAGEGKESGAATALSNEDDDEEEFVWSVPRKTLAAAVPATAAKPSIAGIARTSGMSNEGSGSGSGIVNSSDSGSSSSSGRQAVRSSDKDSKHDTNGGSKGVRRDVDEDDEDDDDFVWSAPLVIPAC